MYRMIDEMRITDAIDYIVSMTVRSWTVATDPIELADAERIGASLLEAARGNEAARGREYSWTPTYEVLVAPAFSNLTGLDAHTRGARDRYTELMRCCALVRTVANEGGWPTESEAGNFLTIVETDAMAALTELERIYG